MVDIRKIDRKIETVMSRLWIGKIDAVEEYCDLIGRTASDGNVGLCSARASLTDIHAGDVGEKFLDTRDRRRGYFACCDDRHDT